MRRSIPAHLFVMLWKCTSPSTPLMPPLMPPPTFRRPLNVSCEALELDRDCSPDGWCQLATPDAAFGGVWAAADDDVFLVGAAGALARYDGTNWSSCTGVSALSLNDVWASARASRAGYGFGIQLARRAP